ncbi:MAG: DUF4349 domain-containing protein [Gemmatimonadota bacterium]
MSRRTRLTLMILMAGLSLSCDMNSPAAKDSATSDISTQAHYDQAAPAPVAEAGLIGTGFARTSPASSTNEFNLSRVRDSVSLSMIIRTGQAWIDVDSLDAAITAVHAMALRVGGFIANTTIQSGEGQQHAATLEIKIPSANYDQAMSGLRGIGKLRSSTTTAEDVGEEYVDVNARMANAHRLEERLVSLLATRTGKLDDVLAVERELARVREEIDRYEGRLRFLRTRTATSTLSVTVSEPAPVVGHPGSNVIVDAALQAWRNFVNLVAGLIAASGVWLPVGLLGVGVWVWRRKRQRPVAAV